MAGYANRTIMLDFPELSEEGDKVHVVIKNPRTVPIDEIIPDDTPMGPDGRPDETKAKANTFKIMAGLVKAWHVYDATSTDDDQPLLPLPATPELVAKLPLDIQERIMDEVAKVRTPGS